MSVYLEVPNKSIYVLQNETKLVKIGACRNAEVRAKVLALQGGFQIVNLYYTQPCSNSQEVKNHIYKLFKSNRIKGEWFQVDFGQVVDAIKTQFVELANFEPKKQKCIVPEDIEEAFKRKEEKGYE